MSVYAAKFIIVSNISQTINEVCVCYLLLCECERVSHFLFIRECTHKHNTPRRQVIDPSSLNEKVRENDAAISAVAAKAVLEIVIAVDISIFAATATIMSIIFSSALMITCCFFSCLMPQQIDSICFILLPEFETIHEIDRNPYLSRV